MIIPTYTEQNLPLSEALVATELNYWREEAKRLREELERAATAAMKGEHVLLVYKGREVRLIPENTALRMSGDIP